MGNSHVLCMFDDRSDGGSCHDINPQFTCSTSREWNQCAHAQVSGRWNAHKQQNTSAHTVVCVRPRGSLTKALGHLLCSHNYTVPLRQYSD